MTSGPRKFTQALSRIHLRRRRAAGCPRARARCVVLLSTHDMTISHKPAIGARQPCLLRIYARARACSDDGCLRMTARTRKRRSTQIGQCQSCARAEHGLSCFTQPMHDRERMLSHSICPPACRTLKAHVHLRGQHAGARRRHKIDIGLLRSRVGGADSTTSSYPPFSLLRRIMRLDGRSEVGRELLLVSTHACNGPFET